MNDSEISDLRARKFFPHLKIFNHTYNDGILYLIEKLYWLMWVKQLQNSTELHTPRENYTAEMYTIDISYFYSGSWKTPIQTHQGVTEANWVMFTQHQKVGENSPSPDI